MGQNARDFLLLTLICTAFIAIMAWVAPPDFHPAVWPLRILATATVTLLAWAEFKVIRQPDPVPDLLATISRPYLEREGLCFTAALETHDGRAYLSIYFQNRYERECITTIATRPAIRSFRVTRYPLASTDSKVQCPGGAFGVVRTPIAIPQACQGRQVRFEIGADVKYPHRRGKVLRFRTGRRAGSTRQLSQAYRLLSALGPLCFGIVDESHPASVSLHLPTGVLDSPPSPTEFAAPEILWIPDAGPSTPQQLSSKAA
jgi:hypothetical protein